MFFMVEQELNPENPHCYTTLPIKLDEVRTIIDVGACEGLFAFRMAKQFPSAVVHWFEPFQEMADLIGLGAIENSLVDQIKVHPLAVGATEGFIKFMASDSPDAGEVISCAESDPEAMRATTLDRFVSSQQLELSQRDLIKIDAEGADLNVLKGGEDMIRRHRPQIAVTTYHKDDHPEEIYTWLRDLDLGYRFRLKGFSFWTEIPRPVLLQASTLD
jgi:FkbM family methyltransferase